MPGAHTDGLLPPTGVSLNSARSQILHPTASYHVGSNDARPRAGKSAGCNVVAVEAVQIRRRQTIDFDSERVDGVIRFTVDPEHPSNRAIADLNLVVGRKARFAADFVLLRPRASSGRLLVNVVNRGRTATLPFSISSRPPELRITDDIDAGDGFLLRRGWTILQCGWQWDVRRQPGLLGLEAPVAEAPPGRLTVRFQPSEVHADQILSHWPLDPSPERRMITHVPYPALDEGGRLTVRDDPNAASVEIPASAWRLVEGGTHIALDGGFQPGLVYEFSYLTALAPIVGAGMLAVRDAAAHFGADAEATFGYGVSQTGRFLRQFLYDGMNRTEAGRAAFDGLLPHVAGARRGEFNHRFAQPSAPHHVGAGHEPPYATAHMLQRAGAPVKVIETNTSSEYWRSVCSWTHSDHPDLRQYLFAGTMHNPGMPTLTDVPPNYPDVRCANPLNTVDYLPLLRAALINLEAWVCDGVEPPATAVPDPGCDRESVLEVFDRFSGVIRPDPVLLPRLPGAVAPGWVAAVDADGNEIDGIRLPDLTVPLATHTGWNPRHPSIGGAGQGVDMLGSTLPFPRTISAGDSRRPISQRYRSRDDYIERVEAEVADLVAARHVLPEDVPVLRRRAEASWALFETT